MRKFSFLLLSSLSLNIVFADTSVCVTNKQDKTVTDAVKWYRDSAEKRALYNQVYNVALEYAKSNKNPTKPWGVILDIDETTLDNSWYFKQCGETTSSEDEFSRYVVLPEKSTALPGVKNFTCSIKKMGGYVTMLSNRDGSYSYKDKNVLTATVNNLKAQGICFDQVVLANRHDAPTPENKNPRFEAVTNGTCNTKLMVCSNTLPAHKVIAYFGDNIQDFPKLFQAELINKPTNDSVYNKFSNGYFILPNPMYGSWQNNKFM